MGANIGGSGTASVTASFYDNSLNGAMTGIGFDGTTTSPADVAGQTEGKTTAQLGDIATFQAAGWNIAQNSSLTAGASPKLGWEVSDNSAVWVINSVAGVTDVIYTLSALGGTYTYQGTAYLLGDLWSSSTLFGNSYSSWILGTDYTFQYGGNTVTGFSNAGTYSNIGISILRTGFQVAGAGNTDGTLTIGKAHLTVTADNQTRLYGEANPGFTQTITGFVNGETLATSGVTGTATGSSTADATTTPGQAIILASASGLSATNYDFNTLIDGTLTILAASGPTPENPVVEIVEPPPPPPAPPESIPLTTVTPLLESGSEGPPPVQIFGGSEDGEGSGQGGPGDVGPGGVSVSLNSDPSVQGEGFVTVAVPKEMATAGNGFTFPLPEQVFAGAGADAPVTITLLSGDPLPGWLAFDPASRTFVATAVPDGALPVQVVVTVEGKRTVVLISERAEQ